MKKAKRYLSNNWEGIKNLFKEEKYRCSAEWHISHILSDRFSSRPMGWSVIGADEMARMRTYKANGVVQACRRIPSVVGKVPKQKLIDIFIKSPEINEFRKVENLQKCSKCELLQVCRGFPAVSYGVYGDWTVPDPQCWK